MSDWFLCPSPNPQARVRLFCFPYAGGGTAVFHAWPPQLPDAELWLVNLPGRGTRLAEAPYSDMTQLVRMLARAFGPHARGRFAFYGHSLGARLAFELARSLRRQMLPQPRLLLLGACPAPQLPPVNRPIHALPRAALLTELRRRNGLPAEVAAHPELLDLLLPVVRTDLQLFETAVYAPELPLDVPLHLFAGTRDPLVSADQLAAWQAQTTWPLHTTLFEADHFFINSETEKLTTAVGRSLAMAS